MSTTVGAINAVRELAADAVDTLRRIEDEMEFYEAKKYKDYYKADRPAHWRMPNEARERLVELRLRMERAQL